MAAKVIMPKQGLQMTEGNILRWLKSEGDSVEIGEPIFEMETDKLTIEIGAPATGTLLKIIHPAGDVVPITELVAVIGEPGEDISQIVNEGSATTVIPETDTTPQQPAHDSHLPTDADAGSHSTPGPSEMNRVFASPRARWKAEELDVDIRTVSASGPEGLVIERDVVDAQRSSPSSTSLARKIATQNNISMADITGTGPRGRITKKDVEAVSRTRGSSTEAAPVPSRENRIVELTAMRSTIARRMKESLDVAAQAVHRVEVDMSEVVRMRMMLGDQGEHTSYNDVILKCTATALRHHPRMNSTLTGEQIIEFAEVNLGMAVAVERGLLVPVIRSVDRLSLLEIHREAERIVKLAHEGTLGTDDMIEGTFTVSNLGMYGIDSFDAIIDPPECGILAVGAIKERATAVNGSVVVKPTCNLSLTYDHRIIDGAPAAAFLRTLRQLLETPYRLM